MDQRGQQAGHYLGAGVAFGVAVALSVDDKGEALALGNADAGFNPIGLPENIAAERLQEVAGLVRRAILRLEQTQLAVTPGCGRAGREDPGQNDNGADKNGRKCTQWLAQRRVCQ